MYDGVRRPAWNEAVQVTVLFRNSLCLLYLSLPVPPSPPPHAPSLSPPPPHPVRPTPHPLTHPLLTPSAPPLYPVHGCLPGGGCKSYRDSNGARCPGEHSLGPEGQRHPQETWGIILRPFFCIDPYVRIHINNHAACENGGWRHHTEAQFFLLDDLFLVHSRCTYTVTTQLANMKARDVPTRHRFC